MSITKLQQLYYKPGLIKEADDALEIPKLRDSCRGDSSHGVLAMSELS
jgi:hypothetical protein